MAIVQMFGWESGTLYGMFSAYGATVVSSPTRGGLYSLQLSTSGYFSQTPPLTTPLSEMWLQFAFQNNGGSGGAIDHVFQWRKGTNVLGTLNMDGANKVFKLYTGNKATLVDTGTFVLSWNTWVLLELYIKIADSNGVLTLRTNGIEDASYTGDTKPSTDSDIDNFVFYNSVNCVSTYDDFVLDNAAYPGGLKICAIKPNGAGDRTELTPSTGSNYQCVDEVPVSATDYVYGNTTGLGDLYTLEDLAAEVKSVAAIKVMNFGIRQGATAVTKAKNVVKVSGTEYKGSSIDVGFSLMGIQEVWANNPYTAAAWTPTEVNGIQSGVELVT